MKSARSIKMDYNAMLQKAGSLEDLAERLYRIADSIDRENDRIASGWTGNASGEYRKKISRERDLVRRRAQQLSQSAQGVRRAAKRMYDTDIEKRIDPYGHPYYWIVGGLIMEEDGDSDVHTLRVENKSTITPLSTDMTTNVDLSKWLD